MLQNWTWPNLPTRATAQNGIDAVEEFAGSGVLRPVCSQINKLWSRIYTLEYYLPHSLKSKTESVHVTCGESAEISDQSSTFKLITPQTTEMASKMHGFSLDESDSAITEILQLLEILYTCSFDTTIRHHFRNEGLLIEQTTRMEGYSLDEDLLPRLRRLGGLSTNADSETTDGSKDFVLNGRQEEEEDDELAEYDSMNCLSFEDHQQGQLRDRALVKAFHSTRLTRKLGLYIHDIWCVVNRGHLFSPTSDAPLLGGCDSSDEQPEIRHWVTVFLNNFKYLFPFEARQEVWRVSSLGLSRTIAWLQKHASNSRTTPGNQTGLFNTTTGALRTEIATPLGGSRDNANGRFFGTGPLFSWTASQLVFVGNTKINDCFGGSGIQPGGQVNHQVWLTNSSTAASGFSCLSSLGRLQRHVAQVPRPGTSLDFRSNSETVCSSTTNGVDLAEPVNFTDKNMFWSASAGLFMAHSDKQQELEIEFEGEEGTGLGPTMEFYALLSSEFRRHSWGMWVSEDRLPVENCPFDTGNETRATVSQSLLESQVNAGCSALGSGSDFYVNPPSGLFPAPWPSGQSPPGLEFRFFVLGIAVGKCLLDQRQMDLPFSDVFLNLVCECLANETNLPNYWPLRLLDITHFAKIYPERSRFLSLLTVYLQEREKLKANQQSEFGGENVSAGHSSVNCHSGYSVQADEETQKQLLGAPLDDLCLSLTFASCTRRFGQLDFPLIAEYEPTTEIHKSDTVKSEKSLCLDAGVKEALPEEPALLTASNVDVYIRRSIGFAMGKGIEMQMLAFKAGFERVLPMSSLSIFTARELGKLISGESAPTWTVEELWASCEPAVGYTRQSPTFIMLIHVLANLTAGERRAFLRFLTGCPTLPPGGLKNLHPKLKVAKKDGTTCGPFPSVNTCMHYLKLPEYTCAGDLKHHLMAATKQRGFHLN